MTLLQNFSQIMTNPDQDTVLISIQTAFDAVQKEVRLRKIPSITNISGYERVFDTPQGIINVNGGQPGKMDGGYSTGQTSRLGIAWWTDMNQNKHVKIEADRTQASNFSVPNMFLPSQDPVHLIFDHQFCTKCKDPINLYLSHWIERTHFYCDICMQEKVYFMETGFYPSGRRK